MNNKKGYLENKQAIIALYAMKGIDIAATIIISMFFIITALYVMSEHGLNLGSIILILCFSYVLWGLYAKEFEKHEDCTKMLKALKDAYDAGENMDTCFEKDEFASLFVEQTKKQKKK